MRLLLLLLLGFLLASPLNAQRTWVEVTPMPTPRAYAAIAVLNGHVYVMGGQNAAGQALGVVERYNPASGTWSAVDGLRDPRYNAAAAALGGQILLTGGRESDNEVTDDVEAYDASEDDWESFSSMESDREGHATFVVNGVVYAFGGSGPSGQFLDDAEYYDPSEDDWYDYSFWTLDRARAAFAAVPDGGAVILFGGFSSLGPLPEVERYIPGQGATMLANLPEPRGGLAGATDGTLAYAIGGRNAAEQRLARVDEYVLGEDRWRDGLPLPEPREGAVAISVGGEVHVFGGLDASGQPTRTVYVLRGTTANEPEVPAATASLALDGPNPFRHTARLALALNRPAPVTLTVYDALGRRVALVHDGTLGAGRHAFGLDGDRLAAGVYLVRAVVNGEVLTQRLTRVP